MGFSVCMFTLLIHLFQCEHLHSKVFTLLIPCWMCWFDRVCSFLSELCADWLTKQLWLHWNMMNKVCSFLSGLSLVQIDCDKTIMVSLKHDDKLQDGSECSFQVQIYFESSAMSFWSIIFAVFLYVYFSLPLFSPFLIFSSLVQYAGPIYKRLFLCFQSAVLYTTIDGQRRIRVSTLALPCTTMLSNLFRSADLDTQFACILKQGGDTIS